MVDLRALLAPASVAIVGASADELTLRGRLTHTMVMHPYPGPLYLVSRSRSTILDRPTVPSLTAVDEPIDLAVLLVPASAVAETLEEAGRCGVRAATVIASGFAEEQGQAGTVLQRRIRDVARHHGILLNGPNSEGFVVPARGLAATFSPVLDRSLPEAVWGETMFRPLSIIAQSGALGFGLYEIARHKGLPVDHVITTGNEACLDVCDYLEHVLDHGDAGVLVLYVEEIRNGRRFMALARRALIEGRPIALAKSGVSEAGRRSAISHTGALAGSDSVYDAVFRRLGIARAGGMEELIDIAATFARYIPRQRPEGRRIGIASSSGGAAAWFADSCVSTGLDVPALDADSRARIDPLLPSYGSSANPVDATAQAIYAVGYAGFIEILSESPSIDMVAQVATLGTTKIMERESGKLAAVSRRLAKPTVMWSYTIPARRSIEIAARAGVPLMADMRHAARAMAALADHAEAFHASMAPFNELPDPIPNPSGNGVVLCEAEAREVLSSCGVPVGPAELAASPEAAVSAWRRFERPVALKVQSPHIPHKSDIGAVALDLSDEAAVRAAYRKVLDNVLTSSPTAELRGVLVQPMADPGVETIVGSVTDPTFGPMVMVGLGGLFAETLRDFVLSPAPVDEAEARAMIGRLKGASLFAGTRGRPPSDTEALVALIVRVSTVTLARNNHIAEIDLNPVIVQAHGLTVADALIVTT